MTKVYLNFPLDAIRIIDTLASRGCEYRTQMSDGTRQPCTYVNPCLTCRSRRVNKDLRLIDRGDKP